MMQGTCAKCGFVFLLEHGLDCPACHMATRAERVAKAFKPVDVLRTALGIGTLHTGVDWGSPEWKGVRARADAAMNQDGTWLVPESAQAEVPRGCRIPTTEADQVYQLRRLFRI